MGLFDFDWNKRKKRTATPTPVAVVKRKTVAKKPTVTKKMLLTRAEKEADERENQNINSVYRIVESAQSSCGNAREWLSEGDTASALESVNEALSLLKSAKKALLV